MARVSTYLNFQGQTEEAFAFYAKIFGTEVTMLSRFSDMPSGGPGELPAEERNLVLHAELPITDVDSREAADRLYGALAEGGSEGAPMADMPWGSYWGVILDRYGIRWMMNHTPAS
jgi:PhnB protein